MHEVALLRMEVSSLRKANRGLRKRRRAKETRLQLGGSFTVQNAQDSLDQKAVDEQLVQETQLNSRDAGGACTKIQCCGLCGKPGRNARRCQEAGESSDLSISGLVIIISYCGCVVIEDSCGGMVENYRLAYVIGSLIRYATPSLALQATDCFGLYTYLSGSC